MAETTNTTPLEKETHREHSNAKGSINETNVTENDDSKHDGSGDNSNVSNENEDNNAENGERKTEDMEPEKNQNESEKIKNSNPETMEDVNANECSDGDKNDEDVNGEDEAKDIECLDGYGRSVSENEESKNNEHPAVNETVTQPTVKTDDGKNVDEQVLLRAMVLQTDAGDMEGVCQNLATLIQNTKLFLQDEFGVLQEKSLSSYGAHVKRLKAVIRTVVTSCNLYDMVAVDLSEGLKDLRRLATDMGEYISKKIKEEDLTMWLDLAPNAEEDKVRLLEERRAVDKAHRARAAEARSEVAKAVVSLTDAERLAATIEVELVESIANARRAAEDAELALKAAEEALKAAEEKRKAEEESRRRAEERAQKKAEEERKKKEEEECHLAEAAKKRGTSVADERMAQAERKVQEEAERKNPKNWPRYIYSVDPGEYDPGIGCVIRAISGSFEREDLAVKRIDSLDDVAVLEENEELISNVIAVEPSNPNREFVFNEPFSVAIPHCAPRGNLAREPVIKRLGSNGKWAEINTKDVIFEDIRELKFVEVRMKQFGTFMVVWRTKRDHLFFTKKGGKTTSTTDPRVALTSRPGMFRVNANYTLEVQPVEHTLVSDLKLGRPAQCSELLASSPIIYFTIANRKFSKPIMTTVPVPPHISRPKQRPSTAVSRERTDRPDKRPSTAKAAFLSSSFQKPEAEEVPDDKLFLLKKTGGNEWISITDVPLTQQKNKDIVTFSMPEPYQRFMIIRTKTGVGNMVAEKIAGIIEDALKQKTISLVLRQSNADHGEVALVCTKSSYTEQTIQKLTVEEYDEGPAPKGNIVVREGQIMEVRFRGNVKCTDPGENLKFVFNSRMKCRLNLSVEEIDTFAQKSFECYRGFAQVYTKGLVPAKILSEEEKGRTTAQPQKTQAAMVVGDVLLGELIINLPKPEAEPPQPLNTAPVVLKPGGPVDDDILRLVSENLGDEWKRLAQCLNVKKMRIQAILRQNHNNDTQCSIYDMLLTWAKRLPRCVNKVDILCSALLAVGRADLAEEIRRKDYDFCLERAQIAREAHLGRVFLKVAQDTLVTREWKRFAWQLGLGERDSEMVEEEIKSGPKRCLRVLELWREKQGSEATVTLLVKHLRKCRFKKVANDIYNLS